MSRYIDIDNLHNAKFQNTSGYDLGSAYKCGWNDAIDAICENEPTIDAVSEWIPCSERLPNEQGEYLVTFPLFNGDLYVYVLSFCKGKFYDGEWGDVEYDDVTAWMPLPKPYGERKDQ